MGKQELEALAGVIRDASHRSDDVGRFAASLLPALAAALGDDQQSVLRRTAQRGQGEVEYIVEQSPMGEMLAEHRLSGKSSPFRCPRKVYEDVVGVLATAAKPLLVGEIIGEVEKVSTERPADFQVRVALRLWMHSKPNLVVRIRARYRAADITTFPVAAIRLWEGVRDSSTFGDGVR